MLNFILNKEQLQVFNKIRSIPFGNFGLTAEMKEEESFKQIKENRHLLINKILCSWLDS